MYERWAKYLPAGHSGCLLHRCSTLRRPFPSAPRSSVLGRVQKRRGLGGWCLPGLWQPKEMAERQKLGGSGVRLGRTPWVSWLLRGELCPLKARVDAEASQLQYIVPKERLSPGGTVLVRVGWSAHADWYREGKSPFEVELPGLYTPWDLQKPPPWCEFSELEQLQNILKLYHNSLTAIYFNIWFFLLKSTDFHWFLGLLSL